MAYTKTTWEDLPSTNTPITASNLNKIENQVETNTSDIATNTSNISTNTGNISTLQTTTNNLVARTTDTVIIRTVTTDDSTTFEAFGASYHGGTAPTISGYTPIMCYEATARGNSAIRGYTNIPNATNNAIGCWFNNFSNSSQTVAGFDFKIIYIRNPL